MFDIIEHAEIIIDDQAADLIQVWQDKTLSAMTQIVKKVPQLALIAAMTVATALPDTYGNVPGHTG